MTLPVPLQESCGNGVAVKVIFSFLEWVGSALMSQTLQIVQVMDIAEVGCGQPHGHFDYPHLSFSEWHLRISF